MGVALRGTIQTIIIGLGCTLAPMLALAVSLWPADAQAKLVCDRGSDGLPKNCRIVPDDPGEASSPCDWDCKESNRQQMREYRAFTANRKGNQALDRGDFAKAREFYREALRQIPNYSYALSNLGYADNNERYFSHAMGQEALDRGELEKARTHFQRALALPGGAEDNLRISRALERIDYLDRFKFSGSLMMSGTGSQSTWNLKPAVADRMVSDAQTSAIREQLALAKREWPEGVDTQIYNMGLGIAIRTSEAEDLAYRVLVNQLTGFPVPPAGTSAYNSIKGRRFDQLGCHSNGAMTCLFALHNGDAAANDVVLYGPQITPMTAIAWQRLLASGRIRSLRIVMNTGDPIPPLAMAVNSEVGGTIRQRLRMFDSDGLKSMFSIFAPDVQVEVRSCTFNPLSPFGCHRVPAYPQCRVARSARLVPGTKGFNSQRYHEPPPPQC